MRLFEYLNLDSVYVVAHQDYETLGPGTVKFLFKYSKLEFMVSGPNAK